MTAPPPSEEVGLRIQAQAASRRGWQKADEFERLLLAAEAQREGYYNETKTLLAEVERLAKESDAMRDGWIAEEARADAALAERDALARIVEEMSTATALNERRAKARAKEGK